MFLNIRPIQSPPKKRLEQVKDQILLKEHPHHTEDSYIQWIRRYILFQNQRYPKEIGIPNRVGDFYGRDRGSQVRSLKFLPN